METWHKRIFLAVICLFTLALAGPASAQQQDNQPEDDGQVISPDIERRPISTDAIDTEDFEVGAYVGILSIADFNSEPVYGARAAWHISEDFFLEASYGQSQADLTSFEKLSGSSPLFEDAERDYKYYNLSVGWNALPGEIFLFGGNAFKSDLFVVLGGGNTDFLGDKWFTVTAGVGYRLLLTDWLTWRVDVRDHLFDRDTFGEDETTHNIEVTTGFTVFF